MPCVTAPTTDGDDVVTGPAYVPLITTENTPLSTTGGHTWAAAKELWNFFAETDFFSGNHNLGLGFETSESEENLNYILNSESKFKKILELGSGCGWLGLNLAGEAVARKRAVAITVTEQPGEAYDWLEHNTQKFDPTTKSESDSVEKNISITPKQLDWVEFSSSSSSESSGSEKGGECSNNIINLNQNVNDIDYDLIIGSDLIYNEIGARYLPRTVKKLLLKCQKNYFLYAHTFHRYDLLDEMFLEECTKLGLLVKEIKLVAGESPEFQDVSEAFLEEVFPSKRIAILHISLNTYHDGRPYY